MYTHLPGRMNWNANSNTKIYFAVRKMFFLNQSPVDNSLPENMDLVNFGKMSNHPPENHAPWFFVKKDPTPAPQAMSVLQNQSEVARWFSPKAGLVVTTHQVYGPWPFEGPPQVYRGLWWVNVYNRTVQVWVIYLLKTFKALGSLTSKEKAEQSSDSWPSLSDDRCHPVRAPSLIMWGRPHFIGVYNRLRFTLPICVNTRPYGAAGPERGAEHGKTSSEQEALSNSRACLLFVLLLIFLFVLQFF